MATGFLEVQGFTAALCAIDSMCKTAAIRLLAVDANNTADDSKAAVPVVVQIKFEGGVADVDAALQAGNDAALKTLPPEALLAHRIPSGSSRLAPLLKSGKLPPAKAAALDRKPPAALGVLDVQFFPNAVLALDNMLNHGMVELVSIKKYLGGRIVTLIVGGSSSDAKAAVDAAREQFSGCPALKNSAVITNPHQELFRFLG
ncbi:MAG: BMC domain-containing protein [Treponema sp.]|jgi:microcompartment protein CcmL/EutN|nr:BMC domain-containing protein [Treponema sp.]